MKDKTKFTKKEILVVLACAVFMLLNIGAISSGGRGKAKRAVCLTNLKQLTLAWNIYADDNDQKIVNGEAFGGGDGIAPVPNGGFHKGELWWTGDDIGDFWSGETLSEEIQLKAIRAGALWSYCMDVKLYRCPSGAPANMRHYAIVDSMNGLPRSGTFDFINTGKVIEETVLWIKNKTDIRVPGPAQRIVFIDQGRTTPDSYAVHYLNESWWDPPPMQHGEGTNLSFADGHVESWTWQGKKTIEIGRMTNPLHQMLPETPEEFEDLYRMQKGVWGRLGYVPSHQ